MDEKDSLSGQKLKTITKNPTTQDWRFANTLCDGIKPIYAKSVRLFRTLEEFEYPIAEDLTGLPYYTEYPTKKLTLTHEHFHLIRRIVICEKCPVFQQYRLQAKTLNQICLEPLPVAGQFGDLVS